MAKLKKINKQLRQLVNLKKYDNVMASFLMCNCSRVCLSVDNYSLDNVISVAESLSIVWIWMFLE
jgi:hypothetical protein